MLGQLGSSLSYDRLYQEALEDPTLNRTRQELEVAMTNADLARKVVFELFQDIDRFNLGDYQKFDDDGQGMQRLVGFLSRAAKCVGQEFRKEAETRWDLIENGKTALQFTTDRNQAMQEETLELIGLEHLVIQTKMKHFTTLEPSNRSAFGSLDGIPGSGLLTTWKINAQTKDGLVSHHIINIGVTEDGNRASWLEQLDDKILAVNNDSPFRAEFWQNIALNHKQHIQELLHRELVYSGIISEGMSYSSRLLAVLGVLSLNGGGDVF